MTTLTCMRGYPGSGKSTRARELVEETGAVVVNRDSIREMLHGSAYTGITELEEQVTAAETAQVEALLRAGTSVIVDATHLRGTYLRRWSRIASRRGAEFAVHDVPTDPRDCILRDRMREQDSGRSVGGLVIEKLARKHPIERWPNITADKPFKPEPVEHIHGLPWAVLVDIDGTLAHMNGRSPYDYSRVEEDTADEQIEWLVDLIRADGDFLAPHVIIMSGRPDTCRVETLKWLASNGIGYLDLYMRPADAVDSQGNQLPDYIVKYDLFNTHIRGRFNVRFVLDDRQQVVDLWRAMGLKCLQVAEGNF